MELKGTCIVAFPLNGVSNITQVAVVQLTCSPCQSLEVVSQPT